MKKTKKLILVSSILFFLLTPLLSMAQDGKMVGDEKITCPEGEIRLNVQIGNDPCIGGLGEYIQLWYSFIIGAVGILATVMIMYAGIKWLTSRGNAGVISDAKEKIWSAIIGLVIAFLSYSILSLINPGLLTIGIPDLEKVRVNAEEIPKEINEDVPSWSPSFKGGLTSPSVDKCEDFCTEKGWDYSHLSQIDGAPAGWGECWCCCKDNDGNFYPNPNN